MKRSFISVLALAATIPVWSAEPSAAKECTVAILRGTYLLTGRLDAPGYAPLTGVPQVVGGLRVFDGAGNISGPATVNAGGTILQNVRAPGTYTINADCTGAMTNAGTRHYDLFVASDGSEVIGIRTDPGFVEILRFEKVGKNRND